MEGATVYRALQPGYAVSLRFQWEDEMELLVPGRYRHYKGNAYQVLFVATHSETLEKQVVYKALYGEGAIWVRPVEMFIETVEWEGHTVPRFSLEEEGPSIPDDPARWEASPSQAG